MGRSRVAASRRWDETVGDDESPSINGHPNSEAVRDTHGRVRRVVGERLVESGSQLYTILIALGWHWG